MLDPPAAWPRLRSSVPRAVAGAAPLSVRSCPAASAAKYFGVDITLAADRALAAEFAIEGGARNAHMPTTQCCQAKRAVGAGVLFVTDPHEGRVEELDERCEHSLAWRARLAQVLRHAATDPRQSTAEFQDVIELLRVPVRAPARVIAILLAPACIMPRGLKVAARARADPHITLRGRDSEAADPGELRLVPHFAPVRVQVDEPASAVHAAGGHL